MSGGRTHPTVHAQMMQRPEQCSQCRDGFVQPSGRGHSCIQLQIPGRPIQQCCLVTLTHKAPEERAHPFVHAHAACCPKQCSQCFSVDFKFKGHLHGGPTPSQQYAHSSQCELMSRMPCSEFLQVNFRPMLI